MGGYGGVQIGWGRYGGWEVLFDLYCKKFILVVEWRIFGMEFEWIKEN